MIRSYSELQKIESFVDRFNYLRLDGEVGKETFRFDRYLNQKFYLSKEWRVIRDHVIARDNGCDLGIDGYELFGKIIIHHMNPILLNDIKNSSDYLLNPEYLISTNFSTHNAIHFGNEKLLDKPDTERSRHDTCPWKH